MQTHCPFCSLEDFKSQLIHEFEHVYWIAAKNQYYEGYSILVSKSHVREWCDVPDDIAFVIHNNIRLVTRKIQEKFQPRKINIASFGNVVEHLHWHIVPRYSTDPDYLKAPDLGKPASLTAEKLAHLKRMLMSDALLRAEHGER